MKNENIETHETVKSVKIQYIFVLSILEIAFQLVETHCSLSDKPNALKNWRLRRTSNTNKSKQIWRIEECILIV